ncbi:hypothetical protein QWI17_09585 [Gilvimarinus sp. SDUM040013]|uniref:Uncharacterized protein n=1 Tax=Gilvimarinus gilvus TaxID=3058038 RepID=A0ABU4S3J1_9GAMM|nr:hypothetical protein [Gilvimarinus sp. SDUM040013]MDO3386086.1 hypothetical protein [Gilvimarinus sp. SDUM040013]MDX6850373.1 hypothetical protein [Gilvimarinus sp. SDUM040013]
MQPIFNHISQTIAVREFISAGLNACTSLLFSVIICTQIFSPAASINTGEQIQDFSQVSVQQDTEYLRLGDLGGKISADQAAGYSHSSQLKHTNSSINLDKPLKLLSFLELLESPSPVDSTACQLPWFQKNSNSKKHRISGWKDSNLLYKSCIPDIV